MATRNSERCYPGRRNTCRVLYSRATERSNASRPRANGKKKILDHAATTMTTSVAAAAAAADLSFALCLYLSFTSAVALAMSSSSGAAAVAFVVDTAIFISEVRSSGFT